jgi:hypothetical protein
VRFGRNISSSDRMRFVRTAACTVRTWRNREGTRVARRFDVSPFRAMCIAVVCAGCATPPSPHTSSTVATYRPARPGSIESIEEVYDHARRNPVDDAFLALLVGGLLLGNLLFDQGTGAVVGADDGGWPSTLPDEDSSTLPHYRVLVRFDDGGSITFDHHGDVPFDRGERVELNAYGLIRTCKPCDS